ncbi:hypothetical protein ACSSS7_000842 [Eimeria intestinalis]
MGALLLLLLLMQENTDRQISPIGAKATAHKVQQATIGSGSQGSNKQQQVQPHTKQQVQQQYQQHQQSHQQHQQQQQQQQQQAAIPAAVTATTTPAATAPATTLTPAPATAAARSASEVNSSKVGPSVSLLGIDSNNTSEGSPGLKQHPRANQLCACKVFAAVANRKEAAASANRCFLR